MKRTIIVAAAAGFVLAASGARADITYSAGNTGGIGEVNILFQTVDIGGTVTGQVDHSGALVTFDSLTGQDLDQKPGGQADIVCINSAGFNPCIDNSSGGKPDFSTQLNSIEMKAGKDAAGLNTAWTDAIIDVENGIGHALITATDNVGDTFTDKLGPGSNFVTMIAGPDMLGNQEFITDIKVTHDTTDFPLETAFGFDDLKQPRVSGLCELVPGTRSCTLINIPVPEPTSLALLAGGLLGLGWIRRRRA